jgi:hypothetical protein
MSSVRVTRVACSAVALAFAASAGAQSLKPFQQEALDAILATVDPEIRPVMRAQLEPTLGMLNEQQVAMMLSSFASSQEEADSVPDEPEREQSMASAEDLAYNRAQYEPVIRRLWEAGKAFDDFVAGRIEAHCEAGREFAVYGSAWRYEVYPLDPTWPRVSNGPDLDVQIIGGTYAPQDGRYDFDFSEVRTDFSAAAVERAIVNACAEYGTIGEAFLAEARAKITEDNLEEGMPIEGEANGNVQRVRSQLETVLQAQAPGGNSAIYTALLNGRRTD